MIGAVFLVKMALGLTALAGAGWVVVPLAGAGWVLVPLAGAESRRQCMLRMFM